MKIFYGVGVLALLAMVMVSCKLPETDKVTEKQSSRRVLENDKRSIVILTEEDILNIVKGVK